MMREAKSVLPGLMNSEMLGTLKRLKIGRRSNGEAALCLDRFFFLLNFIIHRFKMHLRPKSSTSFDAADQITPLPPNKTVIDVFVDFMKYLCKCTRDYLQETYPNQPDLWATMERNNAIDFVLTHPNGWEGSQQSQMRQAAIRAGLVPDTSAGHARVRFVTEGEASLHLCIQRGLTTPAMEVNLFALDYFQ